MREATVRDDQIIRRNSIVAGLRSSPVFGKCGLRPAPKSPARVRDRDDRRWASTPNAAPEPGTCAAAGATTLPVRSASRDGPAPRREHRCLPQPNARCSSAPDRRISKVSPFSNFSSSRSAEANASRSLAPGRQIIADSFTPARVLTVLVVVTRRQCGTGVYEAQARSTTALRDEASIWPQPERFRLCSPIGKRARRNAPAAALVVVRDRRTGTDASPCTGNQGSKGPRFPAFATP